MPVIPPDLRPTFLDLAHGSNTGGHLGTAKTLDALMLVGWWPTMRADVDRFVAACDCNECHGKKKSLPATTALSSNFGQQATTAWLPLIMTLLDHGRRQMALPGSS